MIFSRRPFRVTHQGRSGLIYKERGRRALIDCEFYSEPLGICLYRSTWRWTDGSELTVEEADTVLDRLIEYHSQRGYEITQIEKIEQGGDGDAEEAV